MRMKPDKPSRRNPVARYAVRFQRATAFRDRTKYRRHNKHKGSKSYPVCIFLSV